MGKVEVAPPPPPGEQRAYQMWKRHSGRFQSDPTRPHFPPLCRRPRCQSRRRRRRHHAAASDSNRRHCRRDQLTMRHPTRPTPTWPTKRHESKKEVSKQPFAWVCLGFHRTTSTRRQNGVLLGISVPGPGRLGWDGDAVQHPPIAQDRGRVRGRVAEVVSSHVIAILESYEQRERGGRRRWGVHGIRAIGERANSAAWDRQLYFSSPLSPTSTN